MEESITTQPSASASGHRRSRVALACQRCKGRKQRCDGVHPTCRTCNKANVPCVYEPTLRPRYPGGKLLYINALEERIAFLEARMPEYGQDHFDPAPPYREAKADRSTVRPRRSISSPTEDSPSEEESPLVDGVAYLSLCASGTTDTVPEPFYIGSSSGATIARMIQSSIFRAARSQIGGGPSLNGHRPGLLSPAKPYPQASPFVDLVPASEFPPIHQAQNLFTVFFERLHTRWPILDRKHYLFAYERQYEQGALPILERSIMHLIYAISARYLQLMKKPCEVNPEQHFAAGIEPMDYILEQHNLGTVQFLALLAIYGQRSPYGAGVWSQIRYAITLCIELGMHRKPTASSPSHNARDFEIRRRTFWACYCLDRLTTLLLGRTFAIADRDINVELPSDSVEFWDLASLEPPQLDSTSWSNILPFIHIIKLRQLQSKIHRTVFRVDIDVVNTMPDYRARLDEKVAAIRENLDLWVQNIPTPPDAASSSPGWMYQPENTYHDSSEFFNLQYHKSILSLCTALLPGISSTDPRFTSCAHSAARVCTTYKRLNQQKILSYTMIALHSCFIAGLTLIYCLWRDKTLFSYEFLEATRACSLCLTIFGEKWPGAVKYSEIFDALSGSVLRSIVDPSGGSESQTSPKPLDLKIELQNSQYAGDVRATAENPSSSSLSEEQYATNQGAANMILGAVKEAFMEVDEEAPGGFQGWRMFTEMVQTEIPPSSSELPNEQLDQQTPASNFGDGNGASRRMAGDIDVHWDSGRANAGGGPSVGELGLDATSPFGRGSWDHGFFGAYE